MIGKANFRVVDREGTVYDVMTNPALQQGRLHFSKRKNTIVVHPKTDMGRLLRARGWRWAT